MAHYSGHCDCGQVKLEVSAGRVNVVNCHCSRCRHLNGSAFATYLVVAEENLTIGAGQQTLSSYRPSDQGVRSFCSSCGSPVVVQNLSYPHLRMVPIGILDQAAEIVPKINIYCDSRLAWVACNCRTTDFAGPIEN